MVKRGTDESILKFVSFKIEMNVAELDILDNVAMWDEGVRVREFQQTPRIGLGDFFPTLKGKPEGETNQNELNSQMEH